MKEGKKSILTFSYAGISLFRFEGLISVRQYLMDTPKVYETNIVK